MKPLRRNLLLLSLLSGSALAGPIVRTGTADALNLTAAWAGGVLPSAAGSVATWDGSSTLSNSMGAALTWGGLNTSGASGAVSVSGAFGLGFATGSTMTVSGQNFTLGNKDAGSLNLGNVTLTGSAKFTFNKTADTATSSFNASNALNFTGTLALRGSTPSSAPGTMQGGTGRFWLNSAAGTQASGTAFALDTGASATDGQDLILGDWDATSTNRRLTLSSLSGFGTIRTDAGVAGTRNLIVDQAGDTVFNGMLLSHASTATPNAIRKISLEKKGIGSLTLAGIVGKETASAGTSAADVDLTVTAGTLVLTAANTRTGATTIGPSGTLQVGNGGTTGILGGSGVTNDGLLVFNYGTGATVTVANLVSGSGSITKRGAGLLALTASSTHSGSTSIEQGTLRIGGHFDNSAASVSSGATLATGLQASAGVGYVKSLSLAAGSASTYRVGSSAWDTIVINDTDAFSIAGSHTITPVYQGGLLPGDQREIIDYSGTLGGSFSNFHLSVGTRFRLVDDVDNANVVLEYTGGNVIWKGNLSSTWDLDTTANWTLESDSSTTNYLQGDTVVFNDSATTGSVTLSGTLLPISTTFSNATLSYTLSGAAIAGGSVSKSGAASTTLLNDNTYTGATTINSGKLSFGNGGATGGIGGGPVSVASGATLELNRSNTTPGAPDLDYKTNAKLRNVSGAGDIVLTGGAILFNYTGSGIGFAEATSWSGFSGSLVIKGGSEFRTIRNGATSMGTGAVVLGDAVSGGILSQTEGSWTWTNPIQLVGPTNKILNRSGAIAGGRILKLQGVISGSGGLTFEDPAVSMNSAQNGFILTGENTLSGTLTIPAGVPLRVGGVPGNTDVSQAGPGAAGSLGTATVANEGTLTFSRTDAHSVPNAITGAGQVVIGLSANTTATQVVTFAGSKTYSGPTTIRNSKLLVNGSLDTSPVTVESTGTLGGGGTVGGTIALAGSIAPGSSIGNLTASSTLTLQGGAKVVWELADWTGTAGSGYDTLSLNGLDVTATTVAPATIVITPASLANFTESNKTFTIASTSGITGLDPGEIVIDSSAFTGTGTWSVQVSGALLQLQYTAPIADPFTSWAASRGLTGNDALRDADPDGDGIRNVLEFLFGTEPNPSNPGSNSLAALPVVEIDPTVIRFIYRRADAASTITPVVQHGTTLTSWSPSLSSPGVTEQVENDGFATGIDRVTVTIPRSLSVNGGLFARLVVAVP